MAEEIQFDENRNIIEPGTVSDDSLDEEEVIVTDANGVALQDGDSIIAIKWLPVKWWTDIKKWEKFTNIRLTGEKKEVVHFCVILCSYLYLE